jgi:hypothetical protein
VIQDTPFALSRRGFISLGLLLLPGFQSRPARIESLSYERVEPLLAGNRLTLPASLAGSNDTRRSAWPRWLEAHDREIRSRLLRGEEDTLVNFVLFGVSFTDRPRVDLTKGSPEAAAPLIAERIQHFLTALNRLSTDRIHLLSKLLMQLGYRTDGEDSERLRQYVAQQAFRYLVERQQYGEAFERSRANDAASSFNPASDLYKNRGLSVDTGFRPNFAIEQALAEVKRRRLLRSVKRVAIVGPGLDFTDKDSGFDYYPLQTLQPFALIDSLIRLDMARSSDLKVSVFDISPQPLDHLWQAMARARSKQAYTLQLVLDRTPAWNSAALNYWRRLGDRIGSGTPAMPAPPQIRNVDRRAVRIRPEIVSILDPQMLNAVTQHVVAAEGERFDLVVATNILIYYDRFEQALALVNIESMLNDGGVFLSNDVVEDYAGLRLRRSGAVSVPYTPAQADEVSIYSMSRFQPQLAPA